MCVFEKIFQSLLHEDVMSSTAFGANVKGEYGNQFPSQNSKAYNDGDNRPIDPYKAILGYKKKRKKTPIQRRSFPSL
jgi:hypothetical protein